MNEIDEINIVHDRHYIRTDAESRIIHGFSSAIEQPEDGDICINEQGGCQFRLIVGGVPTEENPPLRDEHGVPLYRWDVQNEIITARTPQELEADRPKPGTPPLDAAEFILGLMEAFS